MRRFIRWVLIVLASLLVLAVGAAGGVYLLSERVLGRIYDVPLEDIAVHTDAAHVAEGERLAFLRGCNGCHELDLGGDVFFEEPGVGRLVAANLTQVAATSTNAELARTIRHGVKRDGHAVFGMPSPMFYDLSDEDLGTIIAYLRSLPRVDDPLPPFWVGPTGRLGLALGKFTPETDDVDHTRPRVPVEPRGRYLAATCCSECHGADLKGDGIKTPDLGVVASYSLPEFRVFMLTGMARGGRELRMMSGVARWRFSHFRPDEVGALHAYLSGPR